MDTSKKCYEDRIRDFNRYRRGRTLAQLCRDEGIDYDWIQKAKRKYSRRAQQTPEDSADEADSRPPLIEIHYEDDSEPQSKDEIQPTENGWRISPVILTDPEGNEMTISCGIGRHAQGQGQARGACKGET